MPTTRESFEIIFDADVDTDYDQGHQLHTDRLNSIQDKLKDLFAELGFENVDIWKIEWL